MDNCEKLLRAWLKCEGYEIEDGAISAGEFIARRSSCEYTTVEVNEMYPGKHIECKTFGGDYIISEPVTDYKVTKKPIEANDGLKVLCQSIVDTHKHEFGESVL